jgi:hypothetical protein
MSSSNLSNRTPTSTPAGSTSSGSIGGFSTSPPRKEERREGPVATAIERQTSKLPSDWFLWGAAGAIGLSLALQAANQKERANFVGQWAPTLLILGLYNKLVKVAGSDQESAELEPRTL